MSPWAVTAIFLPSGERARPLHAVSGVWVMPWRLGDAAESDFDFRGFAGAGVELPDGEVALEDDGVAVVGDAWARGSGRR